MNTQQTIYNTPEEFLLTTDFSSRVESVGEKYQLHVDQVGELDAEIRDIVRGSSKSADFIENICRRLEINKELAGKIAIDINAEVFEAMKTLIKSQTQDSNLGQNGTATNTNGNTIEQNSADKIDISAIERAGKFEILKDTNGNGKNGLSPDYGKGFIKNDLASGDSVKQDNGQENQQNKITPDPYREPI